MSLPKDDTNTTRVLREPGNDDPSVRLRTAPAVGTTPHPGFVPGLVARCAVEPDSSVREMPARALTRHEPSVTAPALLAELRAEGARARGRALHTLSTIGDRRAWPAITPELPADADGPALPAEALDSPAAEVRERAVRELVAMPHEEATVRLRDALAHPDPVARRHAAPALAARGRPTRSRR
ncbi:hypothetical protein GCM10027160_04730 [Streptomyces calidiresistens]|uniref:HEAT repeat domain-containing protein n=1 Tax=Streptomyces calidiresistens TaxID=1485586 RepID=UPI002B20233A|nr:HEAT repeat domain-containing protein [Streptomyces calidiresistens]